MYNYHILLGLVGYFSICMTILYTICHSFCNFSRLIELLIESFVILAKIFVFVNAFDLLFLDFQLF